MQAAQSALSRDRVVEAERLLASLEESHPECVPPVLLRAQVQAGLGNVQQAEELFLRAVELDPGRAESFYQLGVFYDSRQQYARAAARFREALAKSPGDPRSYDYLGLSLEALGDFKRAESAYRMGLAQNRGSRFDPMLHYNYGRFLMKQNRLDEAKEHLDKGIELVPSVRAVRYERAKLAELLGDLQEARSHAERALALEDPGGVILDMQVHYLLARIYRAQGETALASKYAELSRNATVPLGARSR